MPRRLFLFDAPDRFVAGTVGEPGNRTFYLQARDGVRIVSVSLEKVQVAVLAERIGALLDELERRGLAEAAAAAADDTAGSGGSGDAAPLDEPLNEAFRAGTLTLGWDGDDAAIVIEARAGGDDEDADEDPPEDIADDDPDGPDLIRVRLSAPLARRFADHAVQVVASGRPPCPLCGQPLDPQGHLCPRRNGTFLN
jgi:uncharacterized repeat protein (TIGR03847 family)